MNKHYESIHRYDFLTAELLTAEYVVGGLTDQEIADKYSMPSKTVVWRKRQKFNIKNKYPAKSNKHAETNRQFNITKEKAQQMLLNSCTIQQIADYIGCSLVVAKRRLKHLGLSSTQEHAEKYNFLNIEPTIEQRHLIIGSLLGDGTISKSGAYSCSHSIKQEQYFQHKRTILKSICSDKFQHCVHKEKGVDGENFESLHFTSGCNNFCIEMRKIFYSQSKKIFPYDYLKKIMNPEIMAYWYMDDGTASWSNRGYINKTSGPKFITLGYTYDENVNMSTLLSSFGFCAKPEFIEPKNGWIIKISTQTSPKLFDLIRPHIIPSMLYKIDYDEYLNKHV